LIFHLSAQNENKSAAFLNNRCCPTLCNDDTFWLYCLFLAW
jgi:hypothetical protein